MRQFACLLSICVFAAGCQFDICANEDDIAAAAVESAKSPIIGGSLDQNNHATVALLLTLANGNHALCSGTVIARQASRGWVLTAAHCATGSVDRIFEANDYMDCTSQGDASQCGASYTPTSWQSHPGYDPETFANDFAIVTFDGATAATTVVPVAGGSDQLAVGQSLELSGYGRTYAGANDPNGFQTKRNHVTTTLAMMTASTLRIDATTGKTACFGDSGGPAYAFVAGQRRVVGVASTADQNCAFVANYARVSAVYQDFIAPLLPPAEICPDCTTSASSGAGGAGSSSGSGAGGAGNGSASSGSGSETGNGTGSAGDGGAGSGSESGAGSGSESGSGSGSETGGGAGDGGAGGYGDGGAPGGPGSVGGGGKLCFPVAIECSASPGERGAPVGGGFVALAGLALAWRKRRNQRSLR